VAAYHASSGVKLWYRCRHRPVISIPLSCGLCHSYLCPHKRRIFGGVGSRVLGQAAGYLSPTAYAPYQATTTRRYATSYTRAARAAARTTHRTRRCLHALPPAMPLTRDASVPRCNTRTARERRGKQAARRRRSESLCLNLRACMAILEDYPGGQERQAGEGIMNMTTLCWQHYSVA